MHKQWILMALLGTGIGASSMAGSAWAQEGEGTLPRSRADIDDIQSLQRGARNFMNYCSGCHSLKYLRYNRMAKDLEITPSELEANLMFTSNMPFDTINSSMPADAEGWFGKQPPDLSLIARARSVDYIEAYLKGFYVDKTRPWGVNNKVLPGTSMPFVLADLQGRLTPEEYDRFVRDTANFLDYAGEPVKAKRQSLGIFVTLFLLVFFGFAYMLKKEYWKDVH